jgi:hypothetical protein
MFNTRSIAIIICLIAFGALWSACGYGDDNAQLDHGVLSVDESIAAVHVPCLDTNQDLVLGPDDAGQPLQGGAEGDSEGIDFNADGAVDDADAAFLDVGLRVAQGFDYSVCGDATVEYIVASDDVPAIECDDGSKAMIVVAVGGGVVDLRTDDNAAGVRWMANALLDELEGRDYQTLTVVAGPGLPGIDAELNSGMETWVTHSVRTLLDQYPCAQAVMMGHSHGAITVEVAAARLEQEYGDRILLVVANDRIEDLYLGDTQSRPDTVPVFNIYETNDAEQSGGALEAPNVENWDASGEEAPKDGEEGGANEPVRHTTIDNSPGVRDRIIEEVMDRLP